MDLADSPSFHEALRAAIDARGLGLERIAARLQARGHTISTATLSYWQSGRSAPARASSLAAIGVLEVILDVPRGSLARLAIAARPPEAATQPPLLADVVDRGRAVDAILADWGDTLDRAVTVVAKHTVGHADELGNTPWMISREVLVMPNRPIGTYVVAAGHPFAGVHVEVSARIGCRVRRAVAESENSFSVAQLELPPVARGAAHLLEYDVRFTGLPDFLRPQGQCVVICVAEVREAFLEVRFPPEALPEHVTLVERTAAGEVRSPARMSGHRAGAYRRGYPKGTLALEWRPPAHD